MGKLVSAVIPTYNYARFLPRAIDSVLAQTHDAVECIVVDDGSADHTPEVLARYGGRIRAIRQENRGLSAARNACIRAARGEYIALLDADDFWHPEKIAKQLAYAEAATGPVLVGGAVQLVDVDGVPMGTAESPSGSADAAARLRALAVRKEWVGGSGSGAFIPRCILDDVGLFDEDLRAAEDWDMWLRIAARYPFHNLADVVVSIRRHGTGTFRNAEKMERNQWRVYEKAVARWPEILDRRCRRRMRALILSDAGGEYVGTKHYRMAIRRYAASLTQWPLETRSWRRLARLLLREAGV
jgi:glycosyltransferase involved in cell wall biosynthesis